MQARRGASVVDRPRRGRSRAHGAVVAVVLLSLLAGCMSVPAQVSQALNSTGIAPVCHGLNGCGGGPPPNPGLMNFDNVIDQTDNHSDAAEHVGGYNVAFVSWSTLGITLGQNGFANFVFYDNGSEHLLLTAIDGDSTAGFVIANISNPLNITPIGRYMVHGGGVQEVRITPDGHYALMNIQTLPTAANAPLVPLPGPLAGGTCTVCIQVVDIRNRAQPVLVSELPVDILGTHNMALQMIGGQLYLFYTGQPVYEGPQTGNPPPGDYVGIARFVETADGAYLVPVAQMRDPQSATDPQQSFAHDVQVYENPFTHQQIAYVSQWQGGALTFDVTNPLAPTLLGRYDNPAPSQINNIHWFAPEPAPRGHKLYAWSAPEIPQLSTGTGVIRAYDVTDPSKIQQVGTWTLPGNHTIPGAFVFSPHIINEDPTTMLAAVAHYHAGVWILNIADPTHPTAVGYYFPVGSPGHPYTGKYWWKKPNFDPGGFVPNIFQARWRNGLLYVSERGTGVYVLRYTGPMPLGGNGTPTTAP
ncbi:MAG: LVIVD repeat-containing protein [Thermoplasmatota archaeon]